MLKKLKHIFYYFMYGSVLVIYKHSDLLDILLLYLKTSGIKNYKVTTYYGDIEFNDGTKLHFWNSSKWYAWMSRGEIYFSNGEKFDWNDKMPNFEVLYHFKKSIDRIEKQKAKEIELQKLEQMMKNAPITYIRKQKLKKLKKRGLFKPSK